MGCKGNRCKSGTAPATVTSDESGKMPLESIPRRRRRRKTWKSGDLAHFENHTVFSGKKGGVFVLLTLPHLC